MKEYSERIYDIHMHVIPGIDDGSTDFDMSLAMLKSASKQGGEKVICTCHSCDYEGKRSTYHENLQKLQQQIEKEQIDIKLYPGTEMFSTYGTIDSHIRKLRNGQNLSLNNTGYVLTEFDTNILYPEAYEIALKLRDSGYIPVLAHGERNLKLSVSDYEKLTEIGCLIQVNAYSFADGKDWSIKNLARSLLENKLVSFIGSDAHRMDHRPPVYSNGVKYITCNCEEEYAKQILYKNAERLLNLN